MGGGRRGRRGRPDTHKHRGLPRLIPRVPTRLLPGSAASSILCGPSRLLPSSPRSLPPSRPGSPRARELSRPVPGRVSQSRGDSFAPAPGGFLWGVYCKRGSRRVSGSRRALATHHPRFASLVPLRASRRVSGAPLSLPLSPLTMTEMSEKENEPEDAATHSPPGSISALPETKVTRGCVCKAWDPPLLAGELLRGSRALVDPRDGGRCRLRVARGVRVTGSR